MFYYVIIDEFNVNIIKIYNLSSGNLKQENMLLYRILMDIYIFMEELVQENLTLFLY